jgi:hypothetical protein
LEDQTKVTQDEPLIVCDVDISWLDIPMDEASVMKRRDAVDEPPN